MGKSAWFVALKFMSFDLLSDGRWSCFFASGLYSGFRRCSLGG